MQPYTEAVPIMSGKVTTPTTGDLVDHYWSYDKGFNVLALEVLVLTAGAQSASYILLETSAGVELARITMGTTAAGVIATVLVADSLVQQAAGTIVRCKHVTSDASAVYRFRVWGTPGFN